MTGSSEGSPGKQPRWWPSDGEEPDPRWSLANERTLLAYNRTGLAFLVAGLAVAGSHQVTETSVWFSLVGVPLIFVGGAVAWSGRMRFLAAQQAMRVGEPLEAPVAAALLPVAVVAIAAFAGIVTILELVR